jgi:hypothetical protein
VSHPAIPPNRKPPSTITAHSLSSGVTAAMNTTTSVTTMKAIAPNTGNPARLPLGVEASLATAKAASMSRASYPAVSAERRMQ